MKFRYLFVLFLPVFLLMNCAVDNQAPPPVKYGVLDLSGWDLQKGAVVWLDGSWEFYWKHRLEPKDFISAERPQVSGYVDVPGDFTELEVDGKQLSSDGYGTFRLTVNIPDTNIEYGITFANYGNVNHKLWVNGNLISSREIMLTNEYKNLPGFYYLIDIFEVNEPTIEIIFQVSNSSYIRRFSLGTEKKVISDRFSYFFKTWFYFFLFGGLILMSFYHFSMYLFRKQDKAPLYFGVFCLAISYNTVGTLLAVFFPMISNNIDVFYFTVKMTQVMVYLWVWAIVGFYYSLYPDTVPKKIVRIFQIALFSIFLLFTFLPTFAFNNIIFALVYLIVIPLSLVLVFIIVLRAIVQHNREARAIFILTIPLLIYGILVIIEMFLLVLNPNKMIPHYIKPALIYIYIIIQSILFSRRMSRALSNIEELSRTLEKKVELRTTELQIERNKLQRKNEKIERELDHARQIQMKFIPKTAPNKNIAFYYKPMAMLGGDFFDFIEFPSGRIGLFISDVSGHGVPAAFITSMIKGFNSDNAIDYSSPGFYLYLMNKFLLPLTAGNFVTAFYGIYEPSTREFVFACAGHNAPFIIAPDILANLLPKTGVPLAVFDENKLGNGKNYFLNRSIKLQQGSKLLLFTDGLVEAAKICDDMDTNYISFDEHGFIETLIEGQSLSSSQFIDLLKKRLIEHRGSDEFDDDVCIICMDVK